MAIVAALAYWLIHAGFDRLWQIAAVTIPALLLMAAGLSAVDARVGTMWPRWEQWLRIGGRTTEGPSGAPAAAPGGDSPALLPAEPPAPASDDPESGTETGTFRRRPQTEPEETGVFGMRRSDQYLGKWRRRRRREARRQRSSERLQPPGPLSQVFRIVLVALSVLVIVAAVPPYVSLQLQRSAVGLTQTDGLAAASRAGAAAWAWPGDAGPFVTQGSIYARAAASRPVGGRPAVLDDLALSLAAYERAAGKEPDSWAPRYQAGISALNMAIVAMGPVSPGDPLADIPYTVLIPSIPGLQDWTWLDERSAAEPPESVEGSLWPPYGAPDVAHLYRTMTPAQLSDLSLAFLLEARRGSPQAPEVNEAIALLQRLRAAASLQP
jgi:hypothetical protein